MELVLAGGAVVGCGTTTTPADMSGNMICNANPDPCCLDTQSTACVEKTQCLNEGGQWDYGTRTCYGLDGGAKH
jgi:hypothetical protein